MRESNTHIVVLEVLPDRVHRADRILAALAVDEHGAAQPHELAQQRRELELLLGHNHGLRREDAAENQDVQHALVVTDNDRRPLVQVLLALDPEAVADQRAGNPVKAAGHHLVYIVPLARHEVHDHREDHTPDAAHAQAEHVQSRIQIEAHARRVRRHDLQQNQRDRDRRGQ